MRIYEAGVSVLIMVFVLAQFLTFSAGRLGEQWDSTQLDVDLKRALEDFQSGDISSSLRQYSKIRDPDLLRIPDSEEVGYRLSVNGEPVEDIQPLEGVEISASDVRLYYTSRDSLRLVPALHTRLLRSDYVTDAGAALDYDSVDELADLILALIWDEESYSILAERVETLEHNQNDDGGWGFFLGDESNTLCTSVSLRAVASWLTVNGEVPLSSTVVTDGIAWLKAGVHADGGYGSKERIESSVDMTAHAVLAFLEVGLGLADPYVQEARNFLLRLQQPDGGFPLFLEGESQPSVTALVIEALLVVDAPLDSLELACTFLEGSMVTDGSFELKFFPREGNGTYDIQLESGYVIDCSPRGYEFWGEHIDDPIIAIVDVYGTRENMTVELRIERGRLVLPENKQKIALCFSHNRTPDDTDWWILNAGNPHTAGQGDPIDDPKFDQSMVGVYTHLFITDLVVPDEYEFFAPSEDWLIAIVGDGENTIQDNIGRGYNIGYWGVWMQSFFFNNILAWSSMGSPRINRVCLDLDQDAEYDDIRLTEGDSVMVNGREWILGITENETAVNLSFYQPDLGITRYYYPHQYDFVGWIPESVSGLYHFGVISVYNKPSFSKDYKVVLRDSVESGVYDEAYIFDGSTWNLYPDGSVWIENGTRWHLHIQGDFLVLTRDPIQVTGLSGEGTSTISAEGDFLEIEAELYGPAELTVLTFHEGVEVGRAIFYGSSNSLRINFGIWGGLRETCKVYHALTLVEIGETGISTSGIHDTADLCQQTIKFVKVYNSVIEDRLDLQAWYKHQGTSI